MRLALPYTGDPPRQGALRTFEQAPRVSPRPITILRLKSMSLISPGSSGEAVPEAHAPSVSVLMPCYNAAATLQEAMKSSSGKHSGIWSWWLSTTGRRMRRDGCWRLGRRRDVRVRPLALPHAEIIPALNAGLAACRAPLIARMDADDRSHPHRLSRQVEYLQSHPDIAVVGCLAEGFPAGEVREGFRIYLDWLNSLVSPEEIARQIYVESPLAHPSVMMRRERIARMGGSRNTAGRRTTTSG